MTFSSSDFGKKKLFYWLNIFFYISFVRVVFWTYHYIVLFSHVPGALRRCVPVRHAERGARSHAAGLRGSRQTKFHQEPTAGPFSAHRQQVGHETVRIEEGFDERTDPAESRRTLGHTSLLQLPVSQTFLGQCHQGRGVMSFCQ